jgi:hypothetical protein
MLEAVQREVPGHVGAAGCDMQQHYSRINVQSGPTPAFKAAHACKAA